MIREGRDWVITEPDFEIIKRELDKIYCNNAYSKEFFRMKGIPKGGREGQECEKDTKGEN